MTDLKCAVYVRPAGWGRFSVDLGPHADLVYYAEEKLPKCIRYAMAKGEIHDPQKLQHEGTKVFVPKTDIDELWPGEGKRDYYEDFRE